MGEEYVLCMGRPSDLYVGYVQSGVDTRVWERTLVPESRLDEDDGPTGPSSGVIGISSDGRNAYCFVF